MTSDQLESPLLLGHEVNAPFVGFAKTMAFPVAFPVPFLLTDLETTRQARL